jgi:predicted acylesterase/phospholipase RssA
MMDPVTAIAAILSAAGFSYSNVLGAREQAASQERMLNRQLKASRQAAEAQKTAEAILLKKTRSDVAKERARQKREGIEAKQEARSEAKLARSRDLADAIIMQQLSGGPTAGDKIMQAAIQMGIA